MPRSSRHKSHRQHKYNSKDSKEGSESEEVEMNSKQHRTETVIEFPRKVKEGSVGVRVSKDLESNDAGKRLQVKDQFPPGNADFSGEHFMSKRRKERVDSVVTDRWNGGEDEHGEGLIGDTSDYDGNESKVGVKEEKGSKSKVSVDSNCKLSRRHEDSVDVGLERAHKVWDEVTVVAIENDGAKRSSGKVESRRKFEKESEKKEVHQCNDGMEKEHSGATRDKKVDVKQEKSADIVTGMEVVISEVSRKQAAQEQRILKREVEITEWQLQDDLRNLELEKELEKRIRRRDGSGDKDKQPVDVRVGNDRNLSSREDRIKNGRYNKDERHKDSRYKDKYRDDLDRDHRYRDDKYREERSSRDRTSDRSDNKHLRDEYRFSESRHKRTKLLDSDRDGSPYVDDRSVRSKDGKGRKGSSDDNGVNGDLKSQGSKEICADLAVNALSNSKIDTIVDKGRSESPYLHLDSVDNTIVNNQQKISLSWHSSKQAESAYRSPLSEEKVQLATGFTNLRELTNDVGVTDKVSNSQLVDKFKQRQDHLDELSTENVAASQNERSLISVDQTSPAQLTEKSPPATREHWNSSKIAREQSLDAKERSRRSSSFKDAREFIPNEGRGRESPFQKPMRDEFSQPEARNANLLPISSSSFDRSGQYSGGCSNLIPPSPFRLGINPPSVFGSSEDDLRVQISDRKLNNRYKRSNDLMGRGQGNSWNGIPNWPLPVTNGFIPFQPGPAAAGFRAVVPQFPAPPLFGVRPSMELNSGCVPYHLHEGNRFSGHGHPFGWRGPADDPSQPHIQAHLHGWESSDGTYGWDTSSDLWKGPNGSMNMDFPATQRELDYPACVQPDEAWAGQPSHRSRQERSRLEQSLAEGIEIKRSEDAPLEKTEVKAPRRNAHRKAPEFAKISSTTSACYYLSKLDISMDLAGPELYDQCACLMGLEGSTTSVSKESSGRMPLESCPKETEIVAGSSNHGLKAYSFFPKVTDSVFERAMVLYEKQRESMKVVLRALKNPEKVSLAIKGEKAPTLQAIGSPGENENRSGSSSCDCSGHGVGQLDAISGTGIVADAGSDDACEALRPESIGYRVNLSRIHNPPESTH